MHVSTPRNLLFAIAAALISSPAVCADDTFVIQTPALVNLEIDDFAAALNSEDPQFNATVDVIAKQVIDTVRENPDRIIALRAANFAFEYERLPDDLQKHCWAMTDAEGHPFAWYEHQMNAFMMQVVEQVRVVESNAKLTLAGLPAEFDQRRTLNKPASINQRYDTLIDEVDALLTLHSFILSDSASDYAMLQDAAPNALELAGDRPLIYRANRTWRMMFPNGTQSVAAQWQDGWLPLDPTEDLLVENTSSSSGSIPSSSTATPAASSSGSTSTTQVSNAAQASAGGSGGGGGSSTSGSLGGGGGGGGGGGSGDGSGGTAGTTSGTVASSTTTTGPAGIEPATPVRELLIVTDSNLHPNALSNGAVSDENMLYAESHGAQRCVIFYQGWADPHETGVLNLETLSAQVQAIMPEEYDGYALLDFEDPYIWPWLFQGPGTAGFDQAQEQLVAALQHMKSIRPNAKWSVYSWPVLNNSWAGFTPAEQQYWLANAFAATDLIAELDWFCPSIYDYYPNAVSNPNVVNVFNASRFREVELAVELADGRPVLPIVWNRVHANAWDLAVTPFSFEEWHDDQINLALEAGADGVVFWGADFLFWRNGLLQSYSPDEFAWTNVEETDFAYLNEYHHEIIDWLIAQVLDN